LRDLAINLIAAGIAFVAGFLSRSVARRVRLARLARNHRRIREQRHPRFTRSWLVSYYERGGHPDDLFGYAHERTWIRVPLLMKASWNLDGHREDQLLAQDLPQRMSDVEVDHRALARRGAYLSLTDKDGEPWNELLAVVFGVDETEQGPRLRLGVAEYFQFLSACGPLEDETYRAVRHRWRRTPIRDRVLRSAVVAAECGLGAHGFGMQVAVVFHADGDLNVLIQRRSHSVSLYGGALAVAPVFGCQTLDLSRDTKISLFHNFLREMYEELYGGVEAEQGLRRLDPRWFYKEKPLKRIIAAHERKILEFRLLGFGFDSLNGEMDLMALAFFKKSRFSDIELHDMQRNWEINDIHVWKLFGQNLTDAILEGQFSPGSVYALVRARETLRPIWEGQR
jgi:hypothetical protein